MAGKTMLTPGTRLIQALTNLGFRQIERGDIEMLTYYTDEKTCNQVRLNFRSRTISFISPQGKVLSEKESVTFKEIKQFNQGSS